jgi:hypothetical protein
VTSPTQGSTPKLSDAARHLTIPDGVVTTGWPAVRAKCAEFGVRFDPWQDSLGTVALGKRRDGVYAATVGGVVLSIPRQVGKTFLVGAMLVAMCLLFPGLRVLWTAHHGRTTTNTFRVMQGLCRRKKVEASVRYIRTANGEQEIAFTNGSIIMFGAREHGFGRGFEQVDVEVFDEAQKLPEKALEDMVAATNQARHPSGALLFFMGTPPRPVDDGEAFSQKRARALEAKSPDMVYVEFAADPDADPDDRDQWAKANPSFPHRTPLESMLRLRENLPSDDAWMREALGVWDQVKGKGVLPGPSWQEQEDTTSIPTGRFALGVEVGPDLSWASVALAGQRDDDDWHIELDDDQHTRGRGVDWLVPKLEDLVANNPQVRTVVVDVAGPIATMLEKHHGTGKQPDRWFFRGTRLEVQPVKVSELGQGCSLVLNGIVTGWLHHIGQPQLSAAALSAGKRPLGDTGMWVWSRKLADSDITPVQAATLALIGAQAEKPARARPAGERRSRRAVVV